MSNLSRNDIKIALDQKYINTENKQQRNFKMHLKEIPSIMKGLSYIHQFSHEFTIIINLLQRPQCQAFYDFFIQTMPKSIVQNVKINFMGQFDQDEYDLRSVNLWIKQNKINNCFNKLIYTQYQIEGFSQLQQCDFKTLVLKYLYNGGEELFEKYVKYQEHLKNGNNNQCDEIESEFIEKDMTQVQNQQFKELKLKRSLILDSRMFQEFTNIEKLSIKDSSLNSFTYKVIETFKNITEFKYINHSYPNENFITEQQYIDVMSEFSIPNLNLFKNLQKLTFYLECSKNRVEMKKVLEENFQQNFDLTLYSQSEMSLSDICDYAFFKPNFKVKFVIKYLILIDLRKFSHLGTNELQKLANEYTNLQLVQKLLFPNGIVIQNLPYHDLKLSKKSMFSVRVEKKEQIQNDKGISIINLHFDLFLLDYYNEKVKLIQFKKS